MRNKIWNIKTWILIVVNILIVFVVLLLSATFYTQFSKVLDERVLQQLNSIKTLKKIQFEKLIDAEWNSFVKDSTYNAPSFINNLEDYTSGIYDVTHLHPQKTTAIAFVKVINKNKCVKILDYNKIKNILLERSGMGASGESYLVGNDFRLRSQSRFFPKKTPYTIEVKTTGAIDGLKKNTGTGIFPDYRNINVYSAYEPIEISNLNWVILSEIDVEEVIVPLKAMRQKLIFITICIIILAVFISLLLTKIISNPIIEMKKRLLIMTKGNYKSFNENDTAFFIKKPKEINEMFEALESLKTALSGAVDFSVAVGNMNLETTYQPKSTDDLLGFTLLKMREKLIEFRTKEQKINSTNKRLLVERLEGERKKLARELHDGIGPFLTSLKLYVQNNVDTTLHKEKIKTMIDSTITEVRAMTNALMPATLEDFGIGATINNYVEFIKQSSDITINFEDATLKNDSKIENEKAVNLFRIVQELMNNTIKHAKANQIKFSLSEFNNFISLYYFDDGIGFNTEKVILGSGLINIKERVEILNGTLDINSKKGASIFEIEIPL